MSQQKINLTIPNKEGTNFQVSTKNLNKKYLRKQVVPIRLEKKMAVVSVQYGGPLSTIDQPYDSSRNKIIQRSKSKDSEFTGTGGFSKWRTNKDIEKTVTKEKEQEDFEVKQLGKSMDESVASTVNSMHGSFIKDKTDHFAETLKRPGREG